MKPIFSTLEFGIFSKSGRKVNKNPQNKSQNRKTLKTERVSLSYTKFNIKCSEKKLNVYVLMGFPMDSDLPDILLYCMYVLLYLPHYGKFKKIKSPTIISRKKTRNRRSLQ